MPTSPCQNPYFVGMKLRGTEAFKPVEITPMLPPGSPGRAQYVRGATCTYVGMVSVIGYCGIDLTVYVGTTPSSTYPLPPVRPRITVDEFPSASQKSTYGWIANPLSPYMAHLLSSYATFRSILCSVLNACG